MEEFDYVIVGAGTAGSVLAAPAQRGPRRPRPRAGGRRQLHSRPMWTWPRCGSPCWAARSTGATQRAAAGRSTAGSTYEPRGKLPGGSSNLYIMMHVRGHSSDYDNWAYKGAAGWSYGDLAPYFQKLEDQEDDTNPRRHGRAEHRSTNAGGTTRTRPRGRSSTPARAGATRRCRRLQRPEDEGAGWHHINVKDGGRQRRAEVVPGAGPGPAEPDLAHQCPGDSLVFEGTRCVGVNYRQDVASPPVTGGAATVSRPTRATRRSGPAPR